MCPAFLIILRYIGWLFAHLVQAIILEEHRHQRYLVFRKGRSGHLTARSEAGDACPGSVAVRSVMLYVPLWKGRGMIIFSVLFSRVGDKFLTQLMNMAPDPYIPTARRCTTIDGGLCSGSSWPSYLASTDGYRPQGGLFSLWWMSASTHVAC